MDRSMLDFETGLILLAAAGVLIYYIVVNFRANKRNSAPVETARAIVHYKHPDMEPVLLGSSSCYIYYVTFHTETGEILKLCMYPKDYHALSEGSWGMLTWQSDQFWCFEKEA